MAREAEESLSSVNLLVTSVQSLEALERRQALHGLDVLGFRD